MSTEQFRDELTKLESRRDEINAERTRAEAQLEEAQGRLIAAPTSETLDALARAQIRTSALANALVSLDAQTAEARVRFEAATLEAETKARRARIAEIAEEREQCVADYNHAVSLADELLREPLRKMRTAVERRAGLAREAEPLVREEGFPAGLGHPAVEFTFKPAEVELGDAVRHAYEILELRVGQDAANRINSEREAKRVVLPVRQEPVPQAVEWVTGRVQGW
jgi:DNA repair exonuclease SbcCD ATPase subunit